MDLLLFIFNHVERVSSPTSFVKKHWYIPWSSHSIELMINLLSINWIRFDWFINRTAFLYHVTLTFVDIGVPSQVKIIFSCKSTLWIRGNFVVIIGAPERI